MTLVMNDEFEERRLYKLPTQLVPQVFIFIPNLFPLAFYPGVMNANMNTVNLCIIS